MVKMNMRKIEDTTKRMEGEDSLIEMRYKATTCCYHRDRPSSHILVTGQGNYPNYNEFFICKRVRTGLMNKTVMNGTRKGSLASMS